MKNIKRDVIHAETVNANGVPEVNSSLIIPLKDEHETIGAIAVCTSDTFSYNKDIYKLVQLIARELTLTIRYISKLEEIEKIKSNFTSTIVTDLRSPIIANQSFVEALYNEYVDAVTEDQKEILGNIMANNKKLLSFVNDILDIGRIDSGTLEIFPEKNNVARLLEEAIRNMRILAEQKQIEMINECADMSLEGFFDAEKIIQVFNNLISNSIKFTNNGGQVFLNAKRHGGSTDGAIPESVFPKRNSR